LKVKLINTNQENVYWTWHVPVCAFFQSKQSRHIANMHKVGE